MREGLAVALAAAATEAQFQDLTGLVRDESRGPARVHFVRAVLNIGGKEGRSTVQTLCVRRGFRSRISMPLNR